MGEAKKSKMSAAYLSLWFVVLVWGTTPLLNVYLIKNFAPSVSLFGYSLISFIVLLIINVKHLRELDKKTVAVATLTGTFNMMASLLQKIGLLYTTPANYAFLENLSCAVVPFALWIMVGKKPTKRNMLTVVLCLLGVYILSGVDIHGFSFSTGEILCAAAGVLYGINIALTGVHAKGVKPSLFILAQMGISSVLSFGNIFLLDWVKIGGEPLVRIYYTFSLLPLLALALCGIVANAFCWTLRTKAIQIVNPTAVAVIMPTSAIVTAILSVSIGTDTLSWQLVVGGSIGFAAALLASVGEVQLPVKQNR